MNLHTEPRQKLLKHQGILAWTIPSLLLSALISLPIVFILLSFFSSDSNDWNHIRETVLLEYTLNSLWLMLQVACYTSLIGVSCAWLIAVTDFPGRNFFSWALILPLAAPAYIIAYIYTDLLEFSGPIQTALRDILHLQAGEYYFPQIRSLPGAALMLSLVLYPYVYLLSRVTFSQRSATLFDAARTLGASPQKAFFRIALPSAWPAIVGGVSLVMMETLADFGVVDYFSVPTFSTGIFRTWFAMGDKVAAMKLAGVMFIFVIVLVTLEKYQRKEKGNALISQQDKRIILSKNQGIVASILCSIPIILGCLLPLSILFYYSFKSGDLALGPDFLPFLLNSVWVSSLASAFTLFFALYLAASLLFSNNIFNRSFAQLSTLGYALPGIMLAIALLTPLSHIDHWLSDSLNKLGLSTGLLLSGSIAILVYAYVIRFLTVSYKHR